MPISPRLPLPRLCRRLFSRQQESGAVAMEFALIAPVLFLLILGTIEVGGMMVIRSVMEAAMSSGSRLTAIEKFSGQQRENYLRNQIYAKAPGLINPANITITAQSVRSGGTTSAGSGAAGDIVLYRVSYRWRIITPMLSSIFGDGSGNMNINVMAMTRNESGT